MQMMMVTAAAS